jgi:hypothetical protein
MRCDQKFSTRFDAQKQTVLCGIDYSAKTSGAFSRQMKNAAGRIDDLQSPDSLPD